MNHVFFGRLLWLPYYFQASDGKFGRRTFGIRIRREISCWYCSFGCQFWYDFSIKSKPNVLNTPTLTKIPTRLNLLRHFMFFSHLGLGWMFVWDKIDIRMKIINQKFTEESESQPPSTWYCNRKPENNKKVTKVVQKRCDS